MLPASQSANSQLAEAKRPVRVRARRKRVGTLSKEERGRIIYLFDHSGGDADYAAERCDVIGIQRADVLAVVLADTRRKGPGHPAPLMVLARSAA